jgi:hypothetical protein
MGASLTDVPDAPPVPDMPAVPALPPAPLLAAAPPLPAPPPDASMFVSPAALRVSPIGTGELQATTAHGSKLQLLTTDQRIITFTLLNGPSNAF